MSPKLTKSKHYANLYRDEASGVFYFRKYSGVKRRQFYRSTGIKENEAKAYKIGLEAFNDWIGKVSDESGVIYFERFAKRYLAMKLANPSISKTTKQAFQNQLIASPRSSGRMSDESRPRLLDGFGHLPLDRITNDNWIEWTQKVRSEIGALQFFNARKALIEILNAAKRAGYIEKVPELDLHDADAAPPRELTRDEIRKLFKAAHYVEVAGNRWTREAVPILRENGLPRRFKNWIKLLMFIGWKQGARPGEILQYEWSMLKLHEGASGRIYIPGRITKTRRARTIVLNPSVARVLRFLAPRARSPFLFPSPVNPGKPIGDYQKAWSGVCARSGFDAQMYWLRDTFITRKLKEGVSSVFIAKYVDTSVQMIERKYAVLSDETQTMVAQ